jgi:hypothetical protein
MTPITVTKASGEKESFDENKLRRSLNSAGANQQIIDRIANAISEILYDGISTQKIYNEAFRLLRQYSDRTAGRYKLKEAILELGPTGYPFERFVGELLSRLGYNTRTGIIVEGNCVSHEIDVIAEKDDEHFMIECKFHNRKGHTCNVKIPLYIQSRFKDVETNWRSLPGHEHKQHRGWVVTNTRFTEDALQYGTCAGLKLLSWDYPKHEGLKDLISEVNLHPITCLSTLHKEEKQFLLERNIVFCMQICEDHKILDPLGLGIRQQNKVLKEARAICNYNTVEQ